MRAMMSTGLVAIKKIPWKPVVSVPYANPDENNHAPNENLKLSCYYSGIHATAQVLCDLGKQ